MTTKTHIKNRSVFENKGQFQAGDIVLYTDRNGNVSERTVFGVKFVRLTGGTEKELVWVSGIKNMVRPKALELVGRSETIPELLGISAV